MNARNRRSRVQKKLPAYILDRYRKREAGVHDHAKAFLTPHQTLGVFVAGAVVVGGLVSVIVYTMCGAG
jgi:hypothetical protein